ncbi:MAG: hypothetical protein HOV80_02115 [Polyangiaceae bacterium]|nr:hypothetical protein [Polyangiaceae bacterium]
MSKAWTIAVVVGASLAAVGCGDDEGSGGAGGGTTTSTNGPTTTATSATGSTTTGTTTGSSTSSTTATSGSTASSTATTGGGMAQFAEPCTGNDDCESGVCHDFPNQGGLLCTLTCQDDNECPAPSSGCNNMGFCRPN